MWTCRHDKWMCVYVYVLYLIHLTESIHHFEREQIFAQKKTDGTKIPLQ